jgi:hypothetical protein
MSEKPISIAKDKNMAIGKHGCGLRMDVEDVVIEHFEKSRAGRNMCLQNRIPEPILQTMKPYAERLADIREH